MSRIFLYITLSLALHVFAVFPLLAGQFAGQGVPHMPSPERAALSVPKMVKAAHPVQAVLAMEPVLQPVASFVESESRSVTAAQLMPKSKLQLQQKQVMKPVTKPALQQKKTLENKMQQRVKNVHAAKPTVEAQQNIEKLVRAPAAQSIAAKQQRTGIDKSSATAVSQPTQQTTEILSKEPRFARTPVAPAYPAQAKRRQQQGTVWVDVRLDARGKQVELQLLRSSGVASLDQAALVAVKKWQFLPETQNARGVPSRVHIPIKFAIEAKR